MEGTCVVVSGWPEHLMKPISNQGDKGGIEFPPTVSSGRGRNQIEISCRKVLISNVISTILGSYCFDEPFNNDHVNLTP